MKKMDASHRFCHLLSPVTTKDSGRPDPHDMPRGPHPAGTRDTVLPLPHPHQSVSGRIPPYRPRDHEGSAAASRPHECHSPERAGTAAHVARARCRLRNAAGAAPPVGRRARTSITRRNRRPPTDETTQPEATPGTDDGGQRRHQAQVTGDRGNARHR